MHHMLHPQREAINRALAAGYSYRDVAGLYEVSKTTLHRHWARHIINPLVIVHHYGDHRAYLASINRVPV